jgi:hypothetical protein
VAHQPGALEHAQVLADRRPADGQLVGQLADRRGARAEPGDDLATGRVPEGVEDVVGPGGGG